MNFDGIQNLNLDLPNQVEFNRKTGAQNKQSILTLQSQVNQLLSQAPAGFLPQVYYGLTRGNQTYRFTNDYTVNVSVEGNINDAYEFIANNETEDYISAIGIKINDNQIQIVIRGDYNINENEFTLVNTRTGESLNTEISEALSLQDASYLGEFAAQDNREKQITVLKDLQSGANNAIYASVDRNSDGVYNWTRIGGYVNGKNGTSIYAATGTTMSTVLEGAKVNDIILIGETFTYNDVEYSVGNLYKINSLSPLVLENRGNIRGATGATGETGATGQNGADGHTPYIQDGYWYIDGVNTNVNAIGQNGQDGQDGQSFNMQSGLYSTPTNYGQTGNVDPQGNPLLQLPTLPQSNISGKGYVVYDPLTTPLDPFYDLYFANNGDNDWTIIHPFSGIAGQNGQDGYTPYIQDGYWYINGVNTGVLATTPIPTNLQVNTVTTGDNGIYIKDDHGNNKIHIWHSNITNSDHIDYFGKILYLAGQSPVQIDNRIENNYLDYQLDQTITANNQNVFINVDFTKYDYKIEGYGNWGSEHSIYYTFIKPASNNTILTTWGARCNSLRSKSTRNSGGDDTQSLAVDIIMEENNSGVYIGDFVSNKNNIFEIELKTYQGANRNIYYKSCCYSPYTGTCYQFENKGQIFYSSSLPENQFPSQLCLIEHHNITNITGKFRVWKRFKLGQHI